MDLHLIVATMTFDAIFAFVIRSAGLLTSSHATWRKEFVYFEEYTLPILFTRKVRLRYSHVHMNVSQCARSMRSSCLKKLA
jgi:hypothetical protein